jgi:predicted alpha/beta-fold hydrolase
VAENHHSSAVRQSSSTDAETRVSLEDSAPFVLPLDHPPGVTPFVPASGLSGRHLQTLCGTIFPGRPQLQGTIQRKLKLPDGDFIVLHDDQPADWKRGDLAVLLLHGLGGCHQSGYMTRIADKLHRRNVRTFRMDHRGAGAGAGLAENPYHAGRIDDLHEAIGLVERLCPGSPVSVAGFSLSANLVLRYLGERPDQLPMSLYRAVAVCPPVDLLHCVQKLRETRAGQRYDWHFTRQMIDQIADTPMWREDLPLAQVKRLPRRLYDFDELYTAPASGFRSAEHYYETASAIDVIGDIRVHTSILAAEDDPLVSCEPLLNCTLPHNVTLCVTRHGGHLGFIGRKGVDADRRWMDWRVIEWLLQ